MYIQKAMKPTDKYVFWVILTVIGIACLQVSILCHIFIIFKVPGTLSNNPFRLLFEPLVMVIGHSHGQLII